ncbi:twin-arginine translocase TatA/TatE family subunit [Desulfosoma caldarium]|uniref:Sec-independent protein translocase protein TatA n=1 Tax=Desulfosoma caldarium TaxID=610254 RepID=A0A3N1VHT6_9BACT|nr:twin-arginine translocase TatA/TatE family subunit [Desulfosoma caldarium]ROR01450.1 sec-independent protein translocase protein TatA [Desulfosoma caldarium]
MVFGLGPAELLVVLVVVLFIFGGKRLADVGKALGESVTQFKEGLRSGKPDVRDAQYRQLPEHDGLPPESPDRKGV